MMNEKNVERGVEKIEQASTEPQNAIKPENERLVEYGGAEDQDNPKNWSSTYKWFMVFVLSGMSLTTNLTILVCAPAIPQILAAFDSTSQTDSTLIVTVWNLGATLGNLIFGPLSEIYGRRPVYNIANLLFLIFLVTQTQSKTLPTVIVLRCFNGLSVATTSLNPAIVGDLFPAEKRGRAQALLNLMPLLGPVIGPIIGGAVAEKMGWEWTFWVSTFILGFFGLAFLLFYRETYDPIILRRKAARLRKESGDATCHSKFDDRDTSTRAAFQRLGQAFLRPLSVFLMPLFWLVAFPAALLMSYIYLLATTFASIFSTVYGFSETATGLVFIGLASGMALGSLLCSLVLDRSSKRFSRLYNTEDNSPKVVPESRIPLSVPGYILAPSGLLLYGWTTAYADRVHWIVPIIGTALVGFAMFLVSVPSTTYLADAFGTYRGSAMASLMTLRNGLAVLIPLAGPTLYARLGYGWGNLLLAFVTLPFVVLPLVVLRYGRRMRQGSALTKAG